MPNVFEGTKKPVFIVLGSTGAGKSTFINFAAGKDVAHVGHGLKSATSDITPYIVQNPSNPTRYAVLLDTPGFDDTWLEDKIILSRIIDWLTKNNYGSALRGIIYLHDIAIPRSMISMNIMGPIKIDTPQVTSGTILVTTRWGCNDRSITRRSEADLTEIYWKDMLERGAHMAPFTDSRESAWDILNTLFQADPIDGSLILQELRHSLNTLERQAKRSTSSRGGFFAQLFGRFR
ncbi:hypothetical protein BJ138DRAFT_1152279 [Hygrophoropsis aurantiaca]|uniref:Uncharacterized protein n=1 Tax=Hygrophoropsis aurantiaca TaxID=72124 RepID=A0ACB8AB68_9AGAM|nr:hypothetical protein BJ138DRAFT_1152279 [Hygrophoropsis aurantiaca]